MSLRNVGFLLELAVSCQIELAKKLLELGQSHLFEHWAEPGVEDEEKKAFFDQVCSEMIYLFFWLICYGIT